MGEKAPTLRARAEQIAGLETAGAERMKVIDTELAAIARRVAARNRHRASEIYTYAEAAKATGLVSLEDIEWLVTQISDLHPGLTFKEAAETMGQLAARPADAP